MKTRAVIWCAVSTKAQAADDKDSLENQEKRGREIARQHDWDVIEVLRVPGHSRRYIDIHDVAREMRAKGHNAFDRLLELWDKHGFDVLIVWDGNRFGRTQTLHSYVVERTIDSGAEIFVVTKGWVNEQNKRMFIAMDGYTASSEVDKLVQLRKDGIRRRVRDGKQAALAPFSHIVVPKRAGVPEHLEVNEALRRLWDDVKTLLLEGMAWGSIAYELHMRFGHPFYHQSLFYKTVMNPYFWGNSAIGYKDKFGAWIWDENTPAPDGVEIYYNTHQAVYTGNDADRVQAEIRRRMEIRGRARPGQTHMFRGLLMCQECGSSLAHRLRTKGRRVLTPYYSCYLHLVPGQSHRCTQRRAIREAKVIEAVKNVIRNMLIDGSPDMIGGGSSRTVDAARASRVQTEITSLEKRLEALIIDKAESGSDIERAAYTRQIHDTSTRLDALHSEFNRLRANAESPAITRDRHSAYATLATQGADQFFVQNSPTTINQVLHRLFGRKRLLVRDGEIVGWGEAREHHNTVKARQRRESNASQS